MPEPQRPQLQDQGVRDALTRREAVVIGRRPSKSGAGTKPADLTAEEASRLDGQRYRTPRVARLPKWVLAHVERDAPQQEFLATLSSRVRRAPTKATLEAAEAYLNDLTRRPEAVPAVIDLLDDDLFARISKPQEG